MNERHGVLHSNALWIALWLCFVAMVPDFALAQATDPFETGATSLQTSLIAIATPIAVILIMALGVAAAAGRISWGWPIGIILGVGMLFSAPTIVTWLKGLFSGGGA
jgi:type IV secretory pathway VirB2 component (pilin)